MRVLRILSINLALTLVLLAGVEGAVRLALPEIRPIGADGALIADDRYGTTPGLRPGASGRTDGAPHAVDAQGFWHYPGAAHASTSSSPQWLFLGDSVTMGVGVAPDSTFIGRMAAALDTVAVLNPSLIGYQLSDYTAVMRALLGDPAMRIERVTVLWCLNDAYPPRSWSGATAPTVRGLEGSVFDYLRRHVYTYQWAKATFADRPLAYFRHDRAFYATDRDFAAAYAGLDTLAQIAATYDVRLDLVALPYEAQLRSDGAPDPFEPQRRLSAAARDYSIPFYDVVDAFEGVSNASSLYRYGDGIHFSERGHALVARYLLDHL